MHCAVQQVCYAPLGWIICVQVTQTHAIMAQVRFGIDSQCIIPSFAIGYLTACDSLPPYTYSRMCWHGDPALMLILCWEMWEDLQKNTSHIYYTKKNETVPDIAESFFGTILFITRLFPLHELALALSLFSFFFSVAFTVLPLSFWYQNRTIYFIYKIWHGILRRTICYTHIC